MLIITAVPQATETLEDYWLQIKVLQLLLTIANVRYEDI